MESTQSLHHEASQSTLSVHVEPKHDPVSTATPLLDLDDATLVPQGWPTSPSRIKRPLSTMLLDWASDIALFAFSSCFFVFSLVVMSYDGDLTSENPTATTVLTRATKYSPTIFPLLFASVVGRAAHAILLWRLEKGEQIQVLDTLATSTSLTNTVTSQFQLRQISALSVLLVIIWMLSPIGGQASLRQMSIETVVNRSDSSIRYVVPFKEFNNWGSREFSAPNTLFVSAMFAGSSTKASPVDLWGNVKMPKIEHYEKTAKPDSNGWFKTRSGDNDLAAYVSFVGIPIDGVKNKTATTDYEFHLQTEYLQLTCAFFEDTRTYGPYPSNYTELLPSDAEHVTGTRSVIWWSGDVWNRSKKAFETLKPFNFSYVEYDGAASCSVKNSYVEVEVLCAVNSTCQAVQVRRSQLPQLPPTVTLMNDGGTLRMVMLWMMSSIGFQDGNSAIPPILEDYLRDPSLVMSGDITSTVVQDTTPAWPISDEALSDRFSQLLNSYWSCIYGIYTLTGGINDATAYLWDTNITFLPPKRNLSNAGFTYIDPNSSGSYNFSNDGSKKSKVWTSQGNKYEHIEVIMAHRPWAATLAIASLVLIAFSLVPPLVRHFLTAGQDIAMNFSSLATRNNTHVPIPAGGSFLPASDRFRLLKNLRLRFADAESKSDVGNLVIAAQGVERAEYSRVRKGRLYE
ncbi:unnamed protein product [Alternaria alternata]